jgi:hypothetical protein
MRDRGKCRVADLEEGGVMVLGYNEAMPVISRIDVHESERGIVLQEIEAWELPNNDLAEDAVGVGFHLSLPIRQFSSLPRLQI